MSLKSGVNHENKARSQRLTVTDSELSTTGFGQAIKDSV